MRTLMLLAALLCVAAPSQAQTDVVTGVRAALVTQGVVLTGPCGAFAITGRVAYVLRAEGWGLVAKNPGQNGCTTEHGRFAVDAIMKQDGTTLDILINSETENIPAWNTTGSAPVSSWRAPFALDAPPAVTPQPPVVDTPDSPVDIPVFTVDLTPIEERLAAIEAAIAGIEKSQAAIAAQVARFMRAFGLR